MASLLRRTSGLLCRGFSRQPISTSRVVLNSPFVPIEHEAIYTDEHKRLKESLRKLIDNDINLHVDKWEAKGLLPAYRIFDLDDQP